MCHFYGYVNVHKGVEYSGRYIYPDKHHDKKYIKICSKHIDTSIRNFIVRIVVMVVCFSLAELGPFYKFCFEGVKTSVTEVRIPFTGENSNAEFYGNLLAQLIIGAHGFPGYVMIEIGIIYGNRNHFTKIDSTRIS